RATAAFIAADRAVTFQQAAEGLLRAPRIYAVDTPEFSRRLRAVSTAFTPFDSHRDDPAMWLFSGGTTGRPKAVVQTHRSFAFPTHAYGRGGIGYTEPASTLP